MRRTWLLGLALVVTACGQIPPPPTADAPSPQAILSPVTPPPSPLPLTGLALAPGATTTITAPVGAARSILICNPSDQTALVGARLTPKDSPIPTPSAATSPSAPAPTPAASPFQDGFGGLSSLTASEPPLALPTRRSRLDVSAPLALGSASTFWINTGDGTLSGDRQATAVLVAESPEAYFYLDRSADTASAEQAVKHLADAFGSQIVPRMTPVFGQAPMPDPRGDTHVYAVVSPLVGQERSGLQGYFWPRDPLAVGGDATDLRQHANEKKVFFLSSALLKEPDVTALGTVAHEYQHLLLFMAKTSLDGTPRSEDTWLDEGLAMLAMDVAGDGFQAGDPAVTTDVQHFEADPLAYSLTDWTHNPNGYSYGLSYLFVRYMTTRFGMGLVREVQENPQTGVTGLDTILQRHGTSFRQVFEDWALASWGAQAVQPQALSDGASWIFRPWSIGFVALTPTKDLPRTLILDDAGGPVQVLDAQTGGAP